MQSFKIRCADITVQINAEYDYSKKACAKYIVEDSKPDFVLSPKKEQIEKTAEYLKDCTKEYIEYMTLLWLFSNEVLKHNAAVLHSVGLSLDGEGYVFAAASGVGKTTHSLLWKKAFGDRCTIINGDKPLISIKDDKFYISGTPWCGKEKYSENQTIPLKKFCFIERAKENSICKIDTSDVIRRLFTQLVIPVSGASTMTAFLDFANKMVNSLSFYLLKCNKNDDAAFVAYEGMREQL